MMSSRIMNTWMMAYKTLSPGVSFTFLRTGADTAVFMIFIPPYHRLVSLSLRLMALTEQMRIRFTAELNRFTAVDKE